MNRSRYFFVLFSASVLLAGCSRGGDDDIPADNKDDVAALKNLGAKVEVDDSGHIWRVDLSGAAAADANPLPLDEPVPRGGVHNEDLKHLEGLPGLSVLVLWKTQITDAGLAHLARLKKLRSLNLMQTRVTDKGLDHLGGIEQLEELILFGTQVSDAGIEKLASLSQLKSLNITQTQITERGCETLRRKMPNTDVRYIR